MDNYKVYVHINKVNGKRYYGITKQEVERRWQNGKGYYNNEYFTRAINKHGWNNFEHIVIAKGLTEEEAKWLEIELIREWDTTNRDKGYNISLGGESGNHSEETRKKISEANSGKNNPMYGKTLSEEHRKKISEAFKGHEVTEETRKKIGEAHRGKVISEETRKKISEACKGKNTGKNNYKAKQVYCVELEQYFDTIAEAETITGCLKQNILHCLKGRYKTAGGYHWLYAEEVNEENINKVLSEEYNINGHGKKIYCVELDMYFNSVTEASKIISCSRTGISMVLTGRYKTCGGYHWVYAEDVKKLEIENNKVS